MGKTKVLRPLLPDPLCFIDSARSTTQHIDGTHSRNATQRDATQRQALHTTPYPSTRPPLPSLIRSHTIPPILKIFLRHYLLSHIERPRRLARGKAAVYVQKCARRRLARLIAAVVKSHVTCLVAVRAALDRLEESRSQPL